MKIGVDYNTVKEHIETILLEFEFTSEEIKELSEDFGSLADSMEMEEDN